MGREIHGLDKISNLLGWIWLACWMHSIAENFAKALHIRSKMNCCLTLICLHCRICQVGRELEDVRNYYYFFFSQNVFLKGLISYFRPSTYLNFEGRRNLTSEKFFFNGPKKQTYYYRARTK